jgi:hypothetical protein
METTHNINLKSPSEVNKWDTKRILAYKDRIQKHISYMESNKHCDEFGNTTENDKIAIQKFKGYKEELKRILSTRENLKNL